MGIIEAENSTNEGDVFEIQKTLSDKVLHLPYSTFPVPNQRNALSIKEFFDYDDCSQANKIKMIGSSIVNFFHFHIASIIYNRSVKFPHAMSDTVFVHTALV